MLLFFTKKELIFSTYKNKKSKKPSNKISEFIGGKNLKRKMTIFIFSKMTNKVSIESQKKILKSVKFSLSREVKSILFLFQTMKNI